MTKYFAKLIEAIEFYKNNSIKVDFDNKQTYVFFYDERRDVWRGNAMELPITSYEIQELRITDKELLRSLEKAKKNNSVLEVDLFYMAASVNDKKYERPANPKMYILADHKTGAVIRCQMTAPNEDAGIVLANDVIGYILHYGAPKRIIFRNMITGAILVDICEHCGIFMDISRNLRSIDNFIEEFRGFR